jgi:hypothetical protein
MNKQWFRKVFNLLASTAALFAGCLAAFVYWRVDAFFTHPRTPDQLREYITQQTWLATSAELGVICAVVGGVCWVASAALDF